MHNRFVSIIHLCFQCILICDCSRVDFCCCLSRIKKRNLFQMVFIFVGFIAVPAFAQKSGFPAFTSSPNADGSATYTLSLQTLLLLTSLTFLPALVLMMSSFTRIIIVLSLLRLALGTQSSRLTRYCSDRRYWLFFIMSPVIDRVYGSVFTFF